MLTHKGAPFVLVVVGVVVFGVLGPKWPKDQTLNLVLGDAAARVEEVQVRYREASGEDWTREATFRYGSTTAPRVVHHEARLPDGEYAVEIELLARNSERAVVTREVQLSGGGSTSVDLAEVVPR